MTLKQILMSTAIATMIAGGALAQDVTAPETGMADGGADSATIAPGFTSLAEMTVADMIGLYVYDPEGNQISEIDYVVQGVDGPDVVLGIGGFLGLGEYTVALPLGEFELGEDGNSLRLNTDRETLKTYPEFDETNAESLPGETSIGTLQAAADDAGATMAPAGDTADPVADDAPAGDEAATADDPDMDGDTDADAPADDATAQ